MKSALLFELFPHYNTLCRFVQYTVPSPPLLLQSCNQQGHFSFSVAVLPLFLPFLQNSPYIQAQGKKHQRSHTGYSGAVHNIALPGGRRVRGFVGIEPLVHPCP
ncbi:hypothetical protein DWZ04_11245 [Faecalibacterium prausnitzii]|uniref:Uncharacterized protein n=1 Tax=Faecalibacterium prausnitzii TaxID=853 RepID=A0A3E2UH06_9FIRM|nr:hypothetical protein DWZ04_11245 [Faecalibacterium prausnitzii]